MFVFMDDRVDRRMEPMRLLLLLVAPVGVDAPLDWLAVWFRLADSEVTNGDDWVEWITFDVERGTLTTVLMVF